MEKKYTCYCGLYCGNCAVKAKIEPSAQVLLEEMKKAGFDEIVKFIPGGKEFWPFLENMATAGLCVSCRDGSGNPDCAVRKCAEEKSVEMCALCDSYPCDAFNDFFRTYPLLRQDNSVLREQGYEAWAKIHDERRAKGFVYSQ